MGRCSDKLKAIQEQIPSNVQLIAVSKKQSIEKIREVLQSGHTVFGENYVQELVEKATTLQEEKIEWHMLGHLQKNKINKVLPYISFLHSLDSVELAQQLEKRLTSTLPCYLEINIDNEASKSGVSPKDVEKIVKSISTLQKVKLVGLMTIPPEVEENEASRPYFRQLRLLRDQINESNLLAEPLTELSMGMSHDYPIAIEEGATIVRIGTAIFGERH